MKWLCLIFLSLVFAIIWAFVLTKETYRRINRFLAGASYLWCEYLVNPMGIDAVNPGLSGIITSVRRSELQMACRILVASSPRLLRSNNGNLWDAGKVLPDETCQIVYRGEALALRERWRWKVLIWNGDGAGDWGPVASCDSMDRVYAPEQRRSETLVAGQQFGYLFDTIGNRTETMSGGDASGQNPRANNYYANNLNQITNRDVSAFVDVMGASISPFSSAITVNGQTANRQQEYFRAQIPANNSSSALWTNITVILERCCPCSRNYDCEILNFLFVLGLIILKSLLARQLYR